MKAVFLLVLLAVQAVRIYGADPSYHDRISHVVMLMLENRAFDHMLGYLNRVNPEITGLQGDESNPYDPLLTDDNLLSLEIPVNANSSYIDVDPGHSFQSTGTQIFGYYSETDRYTTPPKMNGFVKDAEQKGVGWGDQVMSCFNPATVPAISTLASEFVVFDRWYSSFPGPTEVNRMFATAATSGGLTSNDAELLGVGMPQDTIFQSLDKANISFNIYMAEVSATLVFSQMRSNEYLDNYKLFENFADDVNNGHLAAYTFIEPRYFSASEHYPANDQHPSHDVAQGELLIKNIYDTLRNSQFWNSTAFIITYDEHGGFYDHYPPPMGVPNPDGLTSSDPICYFDRLGVRIPTILVSPWVAKGRVVHESIGPTSNSQFEHSSLLSTLKNMFQLPRFLTNRDAWAGSFEFLFDELSEPRTDCPKTIPAPQVKNPQDKKEFLQPLNDLHKFFIQLAASLNSDTETAIKISNLLQTEAEGAAYVRYEVQRFIKRSLNGLL